MQAIWIFIVPIGDLESWMEEYGVFRTSNKAKWIVEALKKLHEIEIDDSSLIGKFITDIHNYLVTLTPHNRGQKLIRDEAQDA
jgi:hypothetical protein